VIAVDTNILVYAYTVPCDFNARAILALKDLIGRGQPWAIPWPCAHEFISVMSNPRVQRIAASSDHVIDMLTVLVRESNASCIGESVSHFRTLRKLVSAGAIRGAMVHDARVAAICLDHGVQELWTADRDFSRFPRLKTRNPLVVSA